MGKITKVPNGPLIKKKGPFKGSGLKSGGTVKKAQGGERITSFMTDKEYKKKNDSLSKSFRKNDPAFSISPKTPIKNIDPGFTKTPENYNPNIKRKRITSKDGALQYLKNGNKVKKAKAGAMIKRAQDGEFFTKDGNEYTYTKQVTRPEGKRKYEGKSIDQATAMKIANFKSRVTPSDSLRTVTPKMKKNGGPIKKAKSGAIIKRADGSMSKRGLWDNIRANKGSGKKPTAEMLKQERKIKAKK